MAASLALTSLVDKPLPPDTPPPPADMAEMEDEVPDS